MTQLAVPGPRWGEPPTEIEIHNSGSRTRKRCRWRFSVMDIQGWYPRKRSRALWLGSAIDAALKEYYGVGSRHWRHENMAGEGVEYPDGPTEHDRAAMGWGALEEYLQRYQGPAIDDTVTENYEELCDLARAMWTTYLEWAAPRDEQIEFIVTGRRFRGRLGEYQLPGGSIIPFYYGGEFDGLVLYQGKLYVWENKTSSQMDNLIMSLERDEQAGRYDWAVRKMVAAGAFEHLGVPRDTPVHGTVFNIINKKAPVDVAFNQNGTISKVAKANVVEDYVDALVSQGIVLGPATGKHPAKAKPLDPIMLPWSPKYEDLGYQPEPGTDRMTTLFFHVPLGTESKGAGRNVKTPAVLQKQAMDDWTEQHAPALLRLRDIRWVQRVVTDRAQATLDQIESQLYWEAVEELELRLYPERAYRNPTFSCRIDCGIVELCNTHLKGLPVESMLEEFFWNKYRDGEMPEFVASDVPELMDDEEGYLEPDDLPF